VRLTMVIFSSSVVIVVVMVSMVVPGLVGSGAGDAPDVPHQRLVLGPGGRVRQVPTRVAEVVEAGLLPTEVRTLLHRANAAQSILQIGINLNFLAESRRLDLDESCSNSFHVTQLVVEGDPS